MRAVQEEGLSPDLLNQVRSELLGPEPNEDRLRTFLMRELDLSAEGAKDLIYQAVRQLNLSVFPPVTHLELIHTEGCNLACTYCFEKDMLGYRKMPVDVACAAVDLLFDYSGDEQVLSITHFGGEPTINYDGIRASTEYAESKASSLGKSVHFDMTSNGVLLNEDMVAYFADHQIQVLLSIDGLESTHDRFRVDRGGHGTFKRVIKGLNLLKAKQPWIGVKMTVMPENVSSLFDDVLGLFDLGINQFLIGHATGVAWPDETMITYGEQLAKLYHWYQENPRDDLRIDEFDRVGEGSYFGCPAGRNSIAVSVYGEISPCSKIMGFGSKRLVGKLGDVWHGMTFIKNRYELVSSGRVKAACEEQGIAQDYQGGCFAVNYGESGDLFRPSLQEHAISLLRRSACVGCGTCSH